MPAKKKRSSSRVRRNALLIVCGFLLILMYFEWRTMNGYSKSLAMLQQQVKHPPGQPGRNYTELEGLLSGSPEIVPDMNAPRPCVFYTWSGLMNSFTIRVFVTTAGDIIAVKTGDFSYSIADAKRRAQKNNTTVAGHNLDADGRSGNGLSQESIRAQQQAALAKPAGRKLKDAFLRARSYFTLKKIAGVDFHEALQTISADLPLLKVATGADPAPWNRMTLNVYGAQFDAVRFRSPLDVDADMYWTFTVPRRTGSWYILPAQGRMSAFHNYETEFNLQFDSLDFSAENTVVFQSLLGGRIRAGQEYILWFAPRQDEIVETNIALKLVPAGNAPDVETTPAFAEFLGHPFRRRKFEPTKDGLAGALKAARHVWQYGGYRSAELKRTLLAVAPALRRLQVAGSKDNLVWNTVKLNAEGRQFDAFRFTSPLAEPAELHWVFSKPQGQSLNWYVVAPDGDVILGRIAAEIDLSLDGVQLPEKNVTNFQSTTGVPIQPGREYILWFATNKPGSVDMPLAMRFLPFGTGRDAATARAIAALLGIELPKLTPDRYKATLKRAHDLLQKNGLDDGKFRRVLQSVASAVPEIKLSADPNHVEWNKVRINDQQPGITMVRFKSPINEPADLHWVFAKPAGHPMRWLLISDRSRSFDQFNELVLETNLQLEGVELPERNTVNFQSLQGGQLPPGEEFFLCILPDKNAPFDLHFAIKISSAGTHRASRTAQGIARVLGLRWPGQQPVPAGKLLTGHNSQIAGVCFTADGSRLISVGSGGTVKRWDSATGELSKTSDDAAATFSSAVFSADAKTLVTVSEGSRSIEIWDADASNRLASLPPRAARVAAVAVSSQGKRLAVAEFQGSVYTQDTSTLSFWDRQGQQIGKSVPLQATKVLALSFTPDGKQLIIGAIQTSGANLAQRSYSAVLHFMNVADPEQMTTIKVPGSGVLKLAVSPDGRHLAIATTFGLVRLLDLSNQKVISEVAQDGRVNSLDVSPDGARVAFGCDNASIRIWDVRSERQLAGWIGHEAAIQSVAFSPNGQFLASGAEDASVWIWPLDAVQAVANVPGLPQDAEPAAENSLGMKLVLVPPGQFVMGTSPSYSHPRGYQRRGLEDERPQHRVSITRPFYIGRHEVTVGQFRQFVEASKYKTVAEKSGRGGQHMTDSQRGFVQRPVYIWHKPGFPQDDSHPVVHVCWHDAVAFCRWLSEKEGVTYRLPTEAEWEYACRAGSRTLFSCGRMAGFLLSAGNVADQQVRSKYGGIFGVASTWDDGYVFTAPVGSYAPNSFGIYDMHGNVVEWCTDWFDRKYYSRSDLKDPPGPATGSLRTQRGGSWAQHVVDSRSGGRYKGESDEAFSALGFRVVRAVE